ncbi:hypothetical protein PRIPAC_77233 [Pristionchus pacificus]|uniref:Nuclear receptor n=1 Tax=Pristionchus pacificus TaxID=54126 RepID=A0A8R1Z143_PRIPA|nr:hypothetical protein PRIPAC_77233 [Pristionchus pacificus]|eukprot:PDM79180.1 nuclear receptor [Pristionchus pacificus]
MRLLCYFVFRSDCIIKPEYYLQYSIHHNKTLGEWSVSDPIKHAHLGVNSCRACAVFYKRISEAKRPLKCKGGEGECLQINSKTTCRLCRFTRFDEILQQAAGTSESLTTQTEQTQIETFAPLINHESFYKSNPPDSRTQVLDRLRKGYSLMCVIRNAGELATRMNEGRGAEVRVGNMASFSHTFANFEFRVFPNILVKVQHSLQVLVPACYSTILDHMKIWRQSIKAFANHTFDEFRALDEESKEFIVDSAKGAMNTLDISYRSSHYFPNDDNVRCLSYTTFVRMSKLERFFDNCPNNIDKATIISESKKRFDMSGKSVRQNFKTVKPTDHEFLAMFGLAFWSNEISTLNEKMLVIAMRNREMIMRDLHVYYAQRGITEYAARIGHLHCMLVNMQNHASLMMQDFQLYQLMNLFKQHFERSCNLEK